MKFIYKEVKWSVGRAKDANSILKQCGLPHKQYRRFMEWRLELDRLWNRRIQVTYMAYAINPRRVAGFITAIREVIAYRGTYSMYITDIAVKPGFEACAKGLVNCITRHAIADLVEEIHAIVPPEYASLFESMQYGAPRKAVLMRYTPWGELAKETMHDIYGCNVPDGPPRTHKKTQAEDRGGGGPQGTDVTVPAGESTTDLSGDGGPVDAILGSDGGTTGDIQGGSLSENEQVQ